MKSLHTVHWHYTQTLWAACTTSLDLHTRLWKQILNKCSSWNPYSAGKDFLCTADWDLFLIAWLQDVDMRKKKGVPFLFLIKVRPDSLQSHLFLFLGGRFDPYKCWRTPECSEDLHFPLPYWDWSTQFFINVSGLHILNCGPPSHIFSPALCSSN